MRATSNSENASFKPSPAILLAVVLCVFSTQLSAATLYKWVDEDGKIRYSDRLPANQSDKQHQQLNSQGVVLSTKDAAKPREELAKEAEAKRKLEEEQREQAEIKAIQDQKDKVLLLTFSSEEEIEHARENRIQVIDSVITLIESSIAVTQQKLDELQVSAENNYLSQGKDVPGGLAQKIEHFERKIEIRNAQLAAKVEEKNKISLKYDADLARFRDLKSASN